LPYRIRGVCGFAPGNWVPRFSVWVSENSAVGRSVIWPTGINLLHFKETSIRISYQIETRVFFKIAG
jgi:hypothetical protein